MHDKQSGDSPALTELRQRLADGLAVARLNRTQLAQKARVGRTKVWEALSPGQPLPSAETVAALGRVLNLPVPELLELRRSAVEESDAEHSGRAGTSDPRLGPACPGGGRR